MKSQLVVNPYKKWNQYPKNTKEDVIRWDLMMARWYTEIWQEQQKEPLTKEEKKDLRKRTGQYFKSKRHLYRFWLKYTLRLTEHLHNV